MKLSYKIALIIGSIGALIIALSFWTYNYTVIGKAHVTGSWSIYPDGDTYPIDYWETVMSNPYRTFTFPLLVTGFHLLIFAIVLGVSGLVGWKKLLKLSPNPAPFVAS